MHNKILALLFNLIGISFLSSCSQLSLPSNFSFMESSSPNRLEIVSDDDFKAYLNSLGTVYLNSPDIVSIRLPARVINYLNSVYDNIVTNNEILLASDEKPSFAFIKSSVPFYFSLPNSQFFMSTGLIDKYLNNEDLFVSMFSHEIVKSILNIYEKRRLVPVGYISTERILQMTRVPIGAKMEIHKWAYFVMRRSGYDPAAYLIWLQTQNKNSLDFSMQLSDIRAISREEYLFKNFITSNVAEHDLTLVPINSSQEFYYFVESLRNRI